MYMHVHRAHGHGMHTCPPTHAHPRMPTHAHACPPTRMHAHPRACMPTHTCTPMHAHPCMHRCHHAARAHVARRQPSAHREATTPCRPRVDRDAIRACTGHRAARRWRGARGELPRGMHTCMCTCTRAHVHVHHVHIRMHIQARFLEEACKLRAVCASIQDDASARMPLSYVHLVQVQRMHVHACVCMRACVRMHVHARTRCRASTWCSSRRAA